MALDGLALSVLKDEINEKLLQARVEKIYQPEKEKIILKMRNRFETLDLLLCAKADSPRIHPVYKKGENPKQPPSFCMVMRKHLEGGRLNSVEQDELDRIIKFNFTVRNEAGILNEIQLICEIMGRHSNLILIDSHKNRILDGLKRFSFETNSYREILPGVEYTSPPHQDKINPLKITQNDFFEKLLSFPLEKSLHGILLESFQGLSPQTCKEIIVQSDMAADSVLDTCGEYEFTKLWQSFSSIINSVIKKEYRPTLVKANKQKYKAFAPYDLQQYREADKEYHEKMYEVVRLFFETKEYWNKFKELKQFIEKKLRKEIKRCTKKIEHQQKSISEAKDPEQFRIFGELITANIFRLNRGDTYLNAENFYDPEGGKTTIKLDPKLTPSENAQYYFKKYRKTKSKKEKTKRHLKKSREELLYLESILSGVENSETIEELEDIYEELVQQNYAARGKKKKPKSKPASYLVYKSSDNYSIYVGKNNKQNDYLTLKLAQDKDIWLHVKDAAGSHVIIRNGSQENIPETTIEEAAILAAAYSKNKESSNVPVDYTEKRNVRKPKGAKPGMVIYDNYKTLFVTPDEEKLNELKQRK